MSDCGQIEITPAMIEAGKAALIEWYDSDLLWNEGVQAIYRAMTGACEGANAPGRVE
jgi:hypothetical protein